MTETKPVYSNQVYFCPPSQNIILEQALKNYTKEAKTEWFKSIEILADKSKLFKGKILTNKILSETTFHPR